MGGKGRERAIKKEAECVVHFTFINQESKGLRRYISFKFSLRTWKKQVRCPEVYLLPHFVCGSSKW